MEIRDEPNRVFGRLRPSGGRADPIEGPTSGATAKGAVLLVAALVAALAASPALAQTADLPGGGQSSLPDYVLKEDGTVVIEGDTATDCPSFAAFLEQGYFESGDISAGARRVLDQCVEAGLLAPGAATISSVSPSSLIDASASPGSSAADGEDGGLPDTGGPDLLVPLVILGVLTMVGAARVFVVHLR